VLRAPVPEGELHAIERFGADGHDLGSATPSSFEQKVGTSSAANSPPYGRVRAPALAIYNDARSAAAVIPWLTAADTASPRILRAQQQWRAAQQAEFKARVAHNAIVMLPDAGHYVFLTEPDTVAASMRAFLRAP
jgi:pimeloyl-ACP methyl ester carboxylesterase